MTTETWRKLERDIGIGLANMAQKGMRKAREEERDLAIDEGRIDNSDGPHRGAVYTTAICDGRWATRGYHDKNSTSGHAVVIGQLTGKILNGDYRCRYCSFCRRSILRGDEIPAHYCTMNWAGSAHPMEADIITQVWTQTMNECLMTDD